MKTVILIVCAAVLGLAVQNYRLSRRLAFVEVQAAAAMDGANDGSRAFESVDRGASAMGERINRELFDLRFDVNQIKSDR